MKKQQKEFVEKLTDALTPMFSGAFKKSQEMKEKMIKFYLMNSGKELGNGDIIEEILFFYLFKKEKVAIKLKHDNNKGLRFYDAKKLMEKTDNYISEKSKEITEEIKYATALLESFAETIKKYLEGSIYLSSLQPIDAGSIRADVMRFSELTSKLKAINTEFMEEIDNGEFNFDSKLGKVNELKNQIMEIIKKFNITVPNNFLEEETYVVPTIAELQERLKNDKISEKDMEYIEKTVKSLDARIRKANRFKINPKLLSNKRAFSLAYDTMISSDLSQIKISFMSKMGYFSYLFPKHENNDQDEKNKILDLCKKINSNGEITDEETASLSMFYNLTFVPKMASDEDIANNSRYYYRDTILLKKAFAKLSEKGIKKDYFEKLTTELETWETCFGIMSNEINYNPENISATIGINIDMVEEYYHAEINKNLNGEKQNIHNYYGVILPTKILIKYMIWRTSEKECFENRTEYVEKLISLYDEYSSLKYYFESLKKNRTIFIIEMLLKDFLKLTDLYEYFKKHPSKSNENLETHVAGLLNDVKGIIPIDIYNQLVGNNVDKVKSK